jgi:4-hydroxy-tetrahydrodipicolinate synthase
MMTDPSLSGVLAVAQTPFLEDDSLDADTFFRQADWLFANGADGVVVGMVSEVLRLTANERDTLAGWTAQACAGRGASVVSVGAEATRIAVAHAQVAQSSGVTAVMASPPILTSLDEPAMLRYFSAIVSAVDVPVILQDASGYVGPSLSIDLQAKLWAEFGDRVMFKPEAHPIGPRVTQLLDATSGRAAIFEGTGGLYLIDSYRRGVVGTMPAGDLVWALAALWRALTAGDYDRAYQIGGPLAQIVVLQTSLDSFVAIEKHLLTEQGVFTSRRLREPDCSGLDTQMVAEVDRLVHRLRYAVEEPVPSR